MSGDREIPHSVCAEPAATERLAGGMPAPMKRRTTSVAWIRTDGKINRRGGARDRAAPAARAAAAAGAAPASDSANAMMLSALSFAVLPTLRKCAGPPAAIATSCLPPLGPADTSSASRCRWGVEPARPEFRGPCWSRRRAASRRWSRPRKSGGRRWRSCRPRSACRSSSGPGPGVGGSDPSGTFHAMSPVLTFTAVGSPTAAADRETDRDPESARMRFRCGRATTRPAPAVPMNDSSMCRIDEHVAERGSTTAARCRRPSVPETRASSSCRRAGRAASRPGGRGARCGRARPPAYAC